MDVEEQNSAVIAEDEPVEYATGSRQFPGSDEVSDVCDPAFGRHVCCCCGAGRFVGNMVVLARDRRGRIWLIVGPYWTMLVFVTLPLTVVGPALIAALWCSRLHPAIQFTYAAVVALVGIALLSTALFDPGVLIRHHDCPKDNWTWNDQARTFKPPTARYCPWCDCVINHLDHTCPWTGTAIAQNNIWSFRIFVTLVQLLAYYTAVVIVLGALRVAPS